MTGSWRGGVSPGARPLRFGGLSLTASSPRTRSELHTTGSLTGCMPLRATVNRWDERLGHCCGEWRRRQGAVRLWGWCGDAGTREWRKILLVQDGKFVAQLDRLRWRGVVRRLPTMFTLSGNDPQLHLARSGANWGLRFSSQLSPVVCCLSSSSASII